jgi:hypothetical protein
MNRLQAIFSFVMVGPSPTMTNWESRQRAPYFTRASAPFASMCSMVVLAPVAAAAAK